MDLATMTAAPTILAVGGRTFKVGPLRYLELGVIQRRLNETMKSPLAVAQAEGLEGDEMAEARRLSRGWTIPQVGNDNRWVDALLSSPEGVGFFLYVLFSKHNPDFADADLAHVLEHVGPRLLGPLFDIAMDIAPPPVPSSVEGPPGPKDRAAPSTT